MFTLSFFNQQAYEKYKAGVLSARQANSTLTDMAFHSLVLLSYDLELGRNLMRLLHAFHHLSYMKFGGKMKNPMAWEMLRDRHLLSQTECDYLHGPSSPLRPGSKAYLQVLGWAYQLIVREIRDKRLDENSGNRMMADLLLLRSRAGSAEREQENPMPFGYLFSVNFLLYCWALSVGLYFAGFLSVYGSVAYALVVYVFFSLRNLGIELSEPFGYRERHLPVPEFLMRSYIDHRDLLAKGLHYMRPEGTAIPGGAVPSFVAPLVAKYDAAWEARYYASSGTEKMMKLMQQRFGFEGLMQEDRVKPDAGEPGRHAPQAADGLAVPPDAPHVLPSTGL